MKFKANTQPILEGLDLSIISSNITKFYQKSCIVELTIQENLLRINTEASSIKSELLVKGQSSDEGEYHTFVDSILFKNLMKTLDSDLVEFEINENGLVIYSNTSKFTLPQVADSDMELSRPTPSEASDYRKEIDAAGWNFIKNQQMYAIAMSFIHPVYTNVWVSSDGNVLVGDFDNSIFTHSNQAQLDSTCLLTDTVVNLLTTVPEDSKIINLGKSYELVVDTDPYTYICEFMPKYEEDAGVGDYSSSIILDLFAKSEEYIAINLDVISKYINQAELFTSSADDTISISAKDSTFLLYNDNVNCAVNIDNPFEDFTIVFKISLLKDLISHMDESEVALCPLIQNDEAVGIIMWTDNMEAMLAGVES